MTQQYVAGFLFNDSLTEVALIRKLRPDWQAGKLNAIGGKVEPGESPLDAIRREFYEEAGLKISQWNIFATLRPQNQTGWEVMFYWAIGDIKSVKTLTDERVDIYSTKFVNNCLPNMKWLLPMAINAAKNTDLTNYVIYEQ